MMNGDLRRLSLMGLLSLLPVGGILVAEESTESIDPASEILTCGEFQKLFSYVQEQHLRFFVAPETKPLELIQTALKNTPETLRNLGYSFLAPQVEKRLASIKAPLDLSAKSIESLCADLSPSLIRGVFLKSYFKTLDPYSDFYLPEELEIRSSVVDGEFVGVGIATEPKEDHLLITHVVDDGPAAGKLFVNDQLFKIDNHPIRGLGEMEIRRRIRGSAGSVVSFWLRRGENFLEVPVKRDRVQQRSVMASMVDNQFLHLKVSRFYRQTPLEVEQAIRTTGKKAKGLILDLRNNPGGLLQAARDLVDLFISSGVVVYLRGKEFEEQVWAMNEGGHLKIPIVVLVNEGTASAAEIVAGALQDYGRAIVVGHRTYGKGSVQNVYDTQSSLGLKFRGGFKMTTLFYYLPSGRNVENLEPDIKTLVSDGDPEAPLLEHPQMPYKGPSHIPVVQWAQQILKRKSALISNLKADTGDAPTVLTVEEVGKKLLQKMLADR